MINGQPEDHGFKRIVPQATYRQQLRRKSIGSTNTGAGGAYVPPAPNAAPGPAPTGAK